MLPLFLIGIKEGGAIMSARCTNIVKFKTNRSGTITAAEVAQAMRKVNRSKSSAEQFLKEIGVSFSKTGKIKVRPIL